MYEYMQVLSFKSEFIPFFVCLLALGTGWMFFPRLALVACFPAFNRWRFFPRLALDECFPELAIGYMFSRGRSTVYMFSPACHWLRVCPRLTSFVCFNSRTLHRLCVFPRLAPNECFPLLGTSLLSHVLPFSTFGACCQFFPSRISQ